MGKKVTIFESGKITAESLKDYLSRHGEIEKKLSKNHSRTFLTTDDPLKFQQFVEKNMGMKIKKPQKVTLTLSKAAMPDQRH